MCAWLGVEGAVRLVGDPILIFRGTIACLWDDSSVEGSMLVSVKSLNPACAVLGLQFGELLPCPAGGEGRREKSFTFVYCTGTCLSAACFCRACCTGEKLSGLSRSGGVVFGPSHRVGLSWRRRCLARGCHGREDETPPLPSRLPLSFTKHSLFFSLFQYAAPRKTLAKVYSARFFSANLRRGEGGWGGTRRSLLR